MQYEPVQGFIARTQVESAICEFRRHEKTWAPTTVAMGQLRVLVTRNVSFELWSRSSKFLMATNIFKVFLEAELDSVGVDGDQEMEMARLVGVYISKVVGAVHDEVRRCIIHDITSSLLGDDDSSVIFNLNPALIVIPPTQNQQRSIQTRPDLAIRPKPEDCNRPEKEHQSSPLVVFEIEDYHRWPQDSLKDLNDTYFRVIPALQTAIFVRIFRRRVSRHFVCVAVVMQRASDEISAAITDTLGFGSCPLSASRVVGRIRQLVPFLSPLPREIYPLATHERIASNPWTLNSSNAHNQPFIAIRIPASAGPNMRHTDSDSCVVGGSVGSHELKIQLWPIYHGANQRAPM